LAEVIAAKELVYWKTVPGFMTADPKLIPAARVIERLSWQDAIELTRLGAGVLHPRAIEPARRAGVHVTIRNVTDDGSLGTRLEEGHSNVGPVGLATGREDNSAMRIAIVGGSQAWKRSTLCLKKCSIKFREQPSDPGCLIVAKGDLLQALEVLHEELFEENSAVRLTDREA